MTRTWLWLAALVSRRFAVVLPILIGIGVEFSIQAHSRFEEEVDKDGDGPAALGRLMRFLGPPPAVAMVAAVAGFLSLQLSGSPLIRDFGLMLALGVVALIVAALLVPSSILIGRERRRPTAAGHAAVPHGLIERAVRRMVFAGRRVLLGLVLAGVAIIAVGAVLEGRFTIQTEPEKWIPQGGDTAQGLRDLRDGTGYSAELFLMIEADDVTATEVASWTYEYVEEQVRKHPDELVRGSSLASVAATRWRRTAR